MKKLSGFLVAGWLLVSASALAVDWGECDGPAVSTGQNTAIEKEIADKINEERAREGLPALRLNQKLNVAAQKHAITMGCRGQLSHSIDGMGPSERVEAAGYNWTAVGENIAEGYPDAASVVGGWMQSPGHHHNIVDGSGLGYTETGVGVFRSPNGRLYYCQDFARPADKTAK